MQICVGVHSSCPFLGWECGKFKGVFPARARPARRRKKPNRTAAHNSHSAPSSRGAGSPPPASAWSGCLTGRPARPQSGAAGEGGAGDMMALCGLQHFPPRSPLSGGGMSGAGRGASANSAGIGGFWGAGGAQKGNRRGYSPEHYQARRGAFFARFAGSGFAAARVRPARAAESGVGAGREFPECTGKGAPRPAPHSATGKAFFRPSVGIRRIRANARARWPRPRVSGGVRRPCAGVIFSAISYYRKTSGREFPACSGKRRGE